ncbi:DNA-binding transcription factor yap1 [Rhizopus stolonifer]|uniref:DNA-binding transcription factor yap1 n=1 Tax=Rhizopus stolonifer TaxID=4846 RepID=A0A367JAD1_RHIST|nr:DNA-binding transcription factor yap1 [Rhizopus stolonifer]
MSIASEALQLTFNDSALDLLNAAIASHHQVNIEDSPGLIDTSSKIINSEEDSPKSSPTKKKSSNALHAKRELDKDEQTSTAAPKRAGRKPLDKSATIDAQLDPKQKRKAQNRAAQRAFRDRKEKHVAELQARIEELEALNATKDEDLVKENSRLKEQLKKLQEENYALKGAQFTFEFPVTEHQHSSYPVTNEPIQPSNFYQTSSSSMSSGNSYSGEDGASSSAEQSPLSNTNTHEDDSADTSLFTSTPLQFGLQPANNTLDFLAVSDSTYGLGNGFTTSQNFPTSNDNNLGFPTVDLFHGKDDLFSNYQVPSTSNLNDDFLFADEDLTNLFGSTDDLFGGNQFSLNAQFGLPETPAIHRNKISAENKKHLIEKMKSGQKEGKHVYQIHQEMVQECPDFDLDALCNDLKKKAQCSKSQFLVTDREVEAFVKCLDHV